MPGKKEHLEVARHAVCELLRKLRKVVVQVYCGDMLQPVHLVMDSLVDGRMAVTH